MIQHMHAGMAYNFGYDFAKIVEYEETTGQPFMALLDGIRDGKLSTVQRLLGLMGQDYMTLIAQGFSYAEVVTVIGEALGELGFTSETQA